MGFSRVPRLLLLLHALAAAACGFGASESTIDPSAAGSPAAGGAALPERDGCARDEVALDQLDRDRAREQGRGAAEHTCRAATDCPAGAHCAEGRCLAECRSDSDCGADRHCSCDGVCGDGRPSARAALVCTRDPDLLAELITPEGRRACSFDDECPAGSHCDSLTGACAWHCLEGGAGAAACPSDRVCDCAGQCALPGGEDPDGEVDPLRQRPRLAVTPPVLELGRPGDAAILPKVGTISVRLTAATAPIATASAAAAVTLTAGPEVEVSCDGASFAPRCQWTGGWTFAPAPGGGFVASRDASVRLSAPQTSTRTRFEVAIGSADTLNRRRDLPVHLPRGLSASGNVAFDGEYVGTLTLLGSGTRAVELIGNEVVRDPGFEEQPSRTPSGWWSVEGHPAGGIDRAADGFPYARTGGANGFLYLSHGWSALVNRIRVEPLTDYRLSFWVRTSGGPGDNHEGPRDGWFGVRNAGGHQLIARKYEVVHGWQQQDLDFNSGPDDELYLFLGLWGPGANAWVQFDDVSVRERRESRNSGLSQPVVAIAKSGELVLLDETRQLSASGRVVLPWATDASYEEGFVVPAVVPGDPAPNFGQLTARITQRGNEATHTPGRLAGRFTVELPTATATSALVYAYDLERRGDVARPACSAGCPARTTCQPSLGVCLPGAPPTPASASGNTLVHALALKWREAARALYQAAPFGVPYESLYVERHSKPFGRFDKLRSVGAEETLTGDGVKYCSEFADRFIYRPLVPTMFENGCTSRDDGLPQGWAGPPPLLYQYCDKLYAGGSYFKWFGSNACFRFPWDDQAIATRKETHAPCLVDANGPFREPWFGKTRDFSCNTMWERAAQDRWRDWNTFINQDCVRLEESLTIQENWQERTLAIYLCPISESLVGSSGDVVAERLACYDPDNPPIPGTGNTPLPFRAARRFSDVLAPVSGDMRCDDGTPPKTVELYANADKGWSWFTAGQMLDACLADLASQPPAVGALGPQNGHTEYRKFFARSSCINLARFMTSTYEPDPHPRSLFMRQLQQWLGVHGFVARFGLGRWKNETMLIGAGGASKKRDLAALAPLLARLDKGFDFLLDKQIAERLAAVHHYHLAEDYRLHYNFRAAAVPAADHEQAQNLHVSLLAAALTYLEVVEAYADQAALETYGGCRGEPGGVSPDEPLARLGLSMRYVAAVDATAHRLHERAYGWEDMPNQARFGELAAEVTRARERVAGKMVAIGRCENPLAVRDGEVFLYFDDPVGPKSRFFASSDWLVGKAKPVVQNAQGLLAGAQDAWIAARQSVLQAQRDTAEQARVLEAVKQHYGAPIKRACGLTEVATEDVIAAFDPKTGTYAAETCFIRLGQPDCNTSAYAPDRCLRGEIGQNILLVRQAERDVAQARVALADHIARYDRQQKYCRGLKASILGDLQLAAAYESEVAGYLRCSSAPNPTPTSSTSSAVLSPRWPPSALRRSPPSAWRKPTIARSPTSTRWSKSSCTTST
jgi:hypothetical protein